MTDLQTAFAQFGKNVSEEIDRILYEYMQKYHLRIEDMRGFCTLEDYPRGIFGNNNSKKTEIRRCGELILTITTTPYEELTLATRCEIKITKGDW